ncbi:flavoprotein [Actinomadura xylanilytica]|uniref:flavoprotein n=1 Tax=Actinomadura xylanilytica TaxID=887459 RepID=UPI00255AA88E|nr:flavoprotein [Actinomadura xylanilytica]MDL4772587.1 flavoprotein [Actinomadura xylanilytica]
MSRVLYVICCGAFPSENAHELVEPAQADGWTVCVLTTPYGRRFVDVPRLEKLTGFPVRSEYKQPGEPDALPMPDALVVAPATVNTINKWGAGICDTVALGYLVEGYGLGLPTVVVPHSNRAHMAHPRFQQNLALLRSWGVTVLLDGPREPKRLPWRMVLDAVNERYAARDA